MIYLAHISEDRLREQTVKAHCNETAELAGKFAGSFGHEKWGYCEGMLHDIGKYTPEFYSRLKGSNIKVDHATAGAQLCWSLKGYYQYISYCIAGHHAGLPDTGDMADTGNKPTMCGRLKKKICNYQDYALEIQVPELAQPSLKLCRGKDPSFPLSFFIRMLFSCLVDADFLNTEEFMKDGKVERSSGAPVTILRERLRNHIAGWLDNQDLLTINGRRTEILKRCIAMGQEERGVFRLTVPTGGGKTIASLAFALEHAVRNSMERIIYVIPYTSIIEQNAKVFRDILGSDNVLEHHCNVDYGSGEELIPMQLAAENWDKPIVVTTNVQFFESLFSNKTSKCRKLHNIANSIVIFDEAQMLPVEYLKPCIAAMEELAVNYRSSIVLCTATQPALEGLFSENAGWKELCPRVKEQFEFFKRVQFIKLGTITQEELESRLSVEDQALCILNTKRQVQKLYQAMKGEGVYHLSTAMYPAHRSRILDKIRERLKNGKRCLVISTSLVEAGVDLDFHAVYRQLAGIDSMIQAAGRCNREGKRRAEESGTYIFTLDGVSRVYGQETQIDTAKQILESREEISISDPEIIHDYFARLYHYRGDALDKKEILGHFRKMRFPFAEVSRKFKLIEQKTAAVFISNEDAAAQILSEIQTKGLTRHLMRQAGQYCVNIYVQEQEKFYGAGLIRPLDSNVPDGLWVLKDNGCYSEDMGLDLAVDYGSAVFC